MFEQAVRMKLRFQFRGLLSVEDLWDLSLQNLNDIYKVLKSQQRSFTDSGLLEYTVDENNSLVSLKLEIVKHVFDTKQAENKAKLDSAEKLMKKKRLLEFVAKKQEQEYENMSLEELNSMINEL